jgi:hypothetical protein
LLVTDRWLKETEIKTEFPSLNMQKIQEGVNSGAVQTQGAGDNLTYSYSDLQKIAGGSR